MQDHPDYSWVVRLVKEVRDELLSLIPKIGKSSHIIHLNIICVPLQWWLWKNPEGTRFYWLVVLHIEEPTFMTH